MGVGEGPPRRLRRGDRCALVSPVGRDSSGPGLGEQLPGARRELWVDEHELWADGPRLEKTSPRRSIDTTGEFGPERLDRCERGGGGHENLAALPSSSGRRGNPSVEFPRRIGKVPAVQERFGRGQASNGRTSLERLTKRSSAQTDQLTAAGAYNPALGSRLPAAREGDGIG